MFRDGGFEFGPVAVRNSEFGWANFGGTIRNTHAGKVHYLPDWDRGPGRARITDEHGNVFHPLPNRPYWRAKGVGNRLNPGDEDSLVIEFEPIPPTSKTLRVELPYAGSVIVFAGVPH